VKIAWCDYRQNYGSTNEPADEVRHDVYDVTQSLSL
jgi:hypothetical protein